VVELWRYPVKSMGGERLHEPVWVDWTGIEGDRRLAVVDDRTNKVLSAKTVPRLLEATATWSGVDGVRIRSEDGLDLASGDPGVDEQLSSWLGRPVHLEAPVPGRRSVFDMELDPDDGRVTTELVTPPGSFFDSRSVLHLVTTASLAGEDPRRFRPNLVVDTGAPTGRPEDVWVGEWLHVGGSQGIDVAVRKAAGRCVLITKPQPGLDKDSDLLRRLVREHAGNLGIYIDPQAPGGVAPGDEVTVVEVGPGVASA